MKMNLNCDFSAARRFRVCASKMLPDVPVPWRQRMVGRKDEMRDIVHRVCSVSVLPWRC